MRGIVLVLLFILTLLLFHTQHIYNDGNKNSRFLDDEKKSRESMPESQGRHKQWAGKSKKFAKFYPKPEDFSENTDSRRTQENSRIKNSSIFHIGMKLLASKKSNHLNNETRLSGNTEDQHLESNRIKASRVDLSSKQKRFSRQRRAATKVSNDTLICYGELSCKDKCHNPRTVLHQTKLSCYCDVDCEFFQDCCADYDDFCAKNLYNTTVNHGQNTTHNTSQENLVNQHNRDLWRCYQGEELKGTKGVWMIGSCLKSWPKDHVFYQCKNLSKANKITKVNYRYLPVYTNNSRVYHNRFCAECNGVSSKDMRNFSLSIQCEFSPPQHLSFEEKIQFLFRYCSDKMNWKGIEGQPRRYCIDLTEPEILRNEKQNVGKILGLFEFLRPHRKSSELRSKCIHGKPRIVSTAKENYKNIDCARYISGISVHISCGPNISLDVVSDPNGGPNRFNRKPMSLSIIFNFNNEAESSSVNIKATCDENKVYDPYLETCRDGIPPALLSSSYSNRYHVLLWLHPVEKLPSRLLNETVVHSAIVRTFEISRQKVTKVNITGFEMSEKYRVHFTLDITQEERVKESMKQMLDYTSPFNITIAELLFTVVKATKRILSCFHWQKYDRDQYTVLQDGTSAVSIKKTGMVFKSSDYYINTTSTANDSQAIFVCHQHQLSNCSGIFILLNSNEFTLLHNRSIFVNTSKQFYGWSEYIWQNNSVLVCENFSKHHETKIESNDDALLSMMTVVCMSLSIAGLVFVLVTYSLFSELRTLPGINLMNLSVSILFAQLLWLLGSGQTDTPMACTVIAVILHYLFLVSFMWTSIIAFDTWRAFSTKGRRPLADLRHERMRQCLRYMAIGWLPVMMYVAICVVLDFTDTVDIGYASGRACWMANSSAILYFFAVPVGLFLVFNIVFCFITFRAINVTAAQAKIASDHDIKKNFGIYLRIASLMGFTWIFGFAAPFGWQFLRYSFVILNSLQGVYIALAFTLSKRARNLYKRLFTGKSSSGEATTTSISRTRTKGSEYINEGCDESRL